MLVVQLGDHTLYHQLPITLLREARPEVDRVINTDSLVKAHTS